MLIGDKHIKVQKASLGITQVAGEMGVNAMSMLAGTTGAETDESRVLQLLNMVTPDELMDNDDYNGKTLFLALFLMLLTHCLRNLRGCPRRVCQVRPDSVSEGAPADGRQSAISRCRKDLHQVRFAGLREEGTSGSGWQKIRRPDRGHDILPRGERYPIGSSKRIAANPFS